MYVHSYGNSQCYGVVFLELFMEIGSNVVRSYYVFELCVVFFFIWFIYKSACVIIISTGEQVSALTFRKSSVFAGFSISHVTCFPAESKNVIVSRRERLKGKTKRE